MFIYVKQGLNPTNPKVCELQISSNSHSGTEQKNQHFCTTLIEGLCRYHIPICVILALAWVHLD